MKILGVLVPKSCVTILIPRPKLILGSLNNKEFTVYVGLEETEHCFFHAADSGSQLDF